MQTSTLAQLKKELQTIPYPQVVELCMRLAKSKKDNKELLHYLLFEANDEQQFIAQAKQELAQLFTEINTTHVYYAKKTIRKILRTVNKHIKCSGLPQTTVELLMAFLMELKQYPKLLEQSTQLQNLYAAQLKKITTAMAKLHEDVQYDYQRELKEVMIIY